MRIDAETVYLGLFGNPVGHSHSPYMHNLTLEKMGINALYTPFAIEAKHIGQAVEAVRALNFRGVNVTIPFKEKVIPFLDRLSPGASDCQAVNVISNENGELVGYNTDGQGFMNALREQGITSVDRAVFIGAGGAARSIAYELARSGAKHIAFLDLEARRSAELADFINRATGQPSSGQEMSPAAFSHYGAQAQLIINCSPVGMYPNVELSPAHDISMLKPEAVLCDVIYNPVTTRFLAMGQASGLQTINGLPMFIHQGALSLNIWLGVQPPLDYMKEVMEHKVASLT